MRGTLCDITSVMRGVLSGRIAETAQQTKWKCLPAEVCAEAAEAQNAVDVGQVKATLGWAEFRFCFHKA